MIGPTDLRRSGKTSRSLANQVSPGEVPKGDAGLKPGASAPGPDPPRKHQALKGRRHCRGVVTPRGRAAVCLRPFGTWEMGVAVVQGLKPLSLRLRPFGTLHRLVHGRLPIAGHRTSPDLFSFLRRRLYRSRIGNDAEAAMIRLSFKVSWPSRLISCSRSVTSGAVQPNAGGAGDFCEVDLGGCRIDPYMFYVLTERRSP
jgi:hypothetical protein